MPGVEIQKEIDTEKGQGCTGTERPKTAEEAPISAGDLRSYAMAARTKLLPADWHAQKHPAGINLASRHEFI